LAELLEECCKVEERFFCRVGMMNPDHVVKMLGQLISVYRHEKIFKFLHLPVQSGDNEVLKNMNRRYTVEDFKRIVESFRKEIPEVTLSTDIICGFPGETQEAFQNTLRLVEETQPDIVNISKFYPRPNTPAARMKQIDVNEVRERSRKLTDLVRKVSLSRNLRWVGWTGEILVDEKGKGSSWIGRNYAYKPIVISSDGNLFGKFLFVKVSRAFSTYLEAEIIN
jgi:MiaB/RimO family radical SAM methylthiotransferase